MWQAFVSKIANACFSAFICKKKGKEAYAYDKEIILQNIPEGIEDGSAVFTISEAKDRKKYRRYSGNITKEEAGECIDHYRCGNQPVRIDEASGD